MSEMRTQLEELARLYDVELSYHDITGTRFVASDEALMALLPQLGAQINRPEDIPQALADRRRALAERVLEPVIVAWGDHPADVILQLPEAEASGPFRAQVTLESGERFELSQDVGTLEQLGTHRVDSDVFVRVRFGLGRAVPHGYHWLAVEHRGVRHQARLIAAPVQAWLPEQDRQWGLFAPAYALRSDNDFGVGGLAELEGLVDFTREMGGHVVGTLPLTATFLRELASPSPYAPVSRLFWSGLYVDLERLPELPHCPAAQARLHSEEFKAEVRRLRDRPVADHVAAMALLRSVLEPLSQTAFEHPEFSQDILRQLREQPHLDEYAKFRAVIETRGDSWHSWPAAMKAQDLSDAEYDAAAHRYHAYVQIRLAEQIEALAARARTAGSGLYLDLPLGVHPDGYDAWRFRDQFMSGCSAGAPPDDLFAGGQDWGFRPLMPHAVRESGYEYVIACMRQQFACAGAMRVDHVMGLHRIFCIPHGMTGKSGVYVKYRADEQYAILNIESHRNRCFIIGEDLGTVPAEVRTSMDRHGLLRMYVLQFALSNERASAVKVPPMQAAASINTHDTPTFASFWEGKDIDVRVGLGHLGASEAEQERVGRARMREAVIGYLQDHGVLGSRSETADVLGGALNLAASSEARMTLVNLEDLWGEDRAQNVPGTVDEHPNWQNRCRYGLEALPDVPGLFDTLREIDRRRRR